MSLPNDSLAPVNVKFFGRARDIYGPDGLLPATGNAVGIDLRACLNEETLVIGPGEREIVHSGLAVSPRLPGVAGFVYSRSGLGAVKGVVVAQGVGVIDPDYRGEIRVILLNTSHEPYTIQRGERVAQLIFQPCFQAAFSPVDELDETGRGGGGFGHTGRI